MLKAYRVLKIQKNKVYNLKWVGNKYFLFNCLSNKVIATTRRDSRGSGGSGSNS